MAGMRRAGGTPWDGPRPEAQRGEGEGPQGVTGPARRAYSRAPGEAGEIRRALLHISVAPFLRFFGQVIQQGGVAG